ncbi:MAG: hypothetical protein RBT75_14465 [Anaerolineae bacterium]|nr:hypothetical protein [Anaerolineae bacterium]
MPEWKYAETYRRNLPHWQPYGVPIFLTWRLADSLPAEVVAALVEEHNLLKKDPRWSDSNQDWALIRQKQIFAKVDRLLHHAADSPHWLAQPEVAQLVCDVLHEFDTVLYKLYAYVIMPNHVHVLLEPGFDEALQTPVPFRLITQKLKGITARQANLLLERTGQPFWSPESYILRPLDSRPAGI